MIVPIAAQTVVMINRLLNVGVTGARTLYAGVSLGLLSDASLDVATELFYRSEPPYADAEYLEQGLFEWEEAALVDSQAPPARVLVASAGGGRELVGLADAGYDAVGFDPSPDLVAAGRAFLERTGRHGHLIESEGSTIPRGVDGTFDITIWGWGGISHVRRASDRVRMLSELAARTRPGGIVLVSFLHRFESARRFEVAWRIGSVLRRWLGRPPIEIGDWVEGSFDHYFTHREIVAELEAAGFRAGNARRTPFPHLVAHKA